jgi:hypothetical protein
MAAWPLSMDAQQIPLSELSQSKFKSATAAVTTYHGSAALKRISGQKPDRQRRVSPDGRDRIALR